MQTRPPGRRRETKVTRFKCCPNCGTDLVALEPKRIGELYADPLGDTYWKGKAVTLTGTQRIVLDSIVTGKGRLSHRQVDNGFFMPGLAIAERADITVGVVPVEISKLRAAFRNVDPDFDHIETSTGHGWRWREQPISKAIARLGTTIVLYEDGAVEWRQLYRIQLVPRTEALAMKLLLDAKGEHVQAAAIGAAVGWTNRHSGRELMRRIQRKFAACDASVPVIAVKKGRGYYVVTPGRD